MTKRPARAGRKVVRVWMDFEAVLARKPQSRALFTVWAAYTALVGIGSAVVMPGWLGWTAMMSGMIAMMLVMWRYTPDE